MIVLHNSLTLHPAAQEAVALNHHCRDPSLLVGNKQHSSGWQTVIAAPFLQSTYHFNELSLKDAIVVQKRKNQ